jgi:hypothetical protein
MNHPEPEATIGERDDLVASARAARVAPGVRDDHDLELEPLRPMDREQADGIGTLLLRDGLELLRPQTLTRADARTSRS